MFPQVEFGELGVMYELFDTWSKMIVFLASGGPGVRQGCSVSPLLFVVFIDHSLPDIKVWSDSSLLTCFCLPWEFCMG